MISLYQPKLEDLWFRQQLLNDTNTMSYNHKYGGTISFTKDKWQNWYHKWMNNDKHFYRYIKDDDNFIGEVAYYYDDNRQIYITSIIIYAPYRNKGYGTKALSLLCEHAKHNGIKALYDDIAIDNLAINLFIKCGFKKVLQTDEYILVKKDLN